MLSAPNFTQQKIKKRLDDWLSELNQKDEYYQTQLTAFQAENKNLQHELIQTKSEYLKRLSEIMQHGEGMLSQQMKEILKSLEQNKAVYQDKLRLSRAEDIALKQERQRLEEMQKRLQFLEVKLSEQKLLHQKEMQVMSALEAEYKAKSSEKEKILANIKHLEEDEITPRETKLKKITDEIGQGRSAIGKYKNDLEITAKEIIESNRTINELKKSIQSLTEKIPQREIEYRNIGKELAILEDTITSQNKEKDALAVAVKALKEGELFQQQTALKKLEGLISEQASVLQKLRKEKESIDNQIKDYSINKQNVLDEIRNLQDTKIPQKEAESKRITEAIGKVQYEIEQNHAVLRKIEQEISDKKNKIQELTRHIQSVEEKISQEQHKHQKITEEINLIGIQIQNKTAVDEKLSDTIKNLESIELLRRETKLKEIEDEILKQNVIRQRLLKELTPIETQIQSKTIAREKVLGAIKSLEEIILPQQENKLKEIKEEIKGIPDKIHEQESVLNGIEQGILIENRKMKELQDKDISLKREYQRLLAAQKRLSEPVYRLENEIHKKKNQYNDVMRQAIRLESELSVQNEILNGTKESVSRITDNLAQQEKIYQDIIKETAVLETQSQSRNIEKEKLLNTIQQLEKMELPQKEARLKEIDDNIAKQKSLTQQLQNEILSVEKQIQDKTLEKQKTSDTIKQLEETEIPAKNDNLKKIIAENEHSQTMLNEQQNILAKLEQEVSAENNTLLEVQKKDNVLKAECQDAKANQKKLTDTLAHVESNISRKRIQRDELITKVNQLRSKINIDEEMLLKLREPLGSLDYKIREQKEVLNEETMAYLQDKKALLAPFKHKQWEAIFWLSLIILMMSSFGFIIWFAFIRG